MAPTVTDELPTPPPKKKPILKRLKKRALSWLAPLIVRVLVWTCRPTLLDRSGLPEQGPRICVGWHGELLLMVPQGMRYLEKLRVLVSPSRDGDQGTALAARFGVRVIRGSSSRGGIAALRGLDRVLKEGAWVVILGDGPRGPSRVLKPGPALLSAMTKVPVVPVRAVCDKVIRLKTWDQTAIPLPFARIDVTFLPAVHPVESGDRQAIERMRLAMEAALNAEVENAAAPAQPQQ